MKQNYIDGKGVYHNELNLTLAQIYDSGFEFGCKVTAKDKAEDIIAELEKIKREFENKEGVFTSYHFVKAIDKHISELKGENNA